MNRFLVASLLLVVIPFDLSSQPVDGRPSFKCRRSVSERLRDHFDNSEVPASVILNNDNPFEASGRETIHVGKYAVEWIPRPGGPPAAEGVAVRIDGTTVQIAHGESLNVVDEGKRRKLGFVDRWDQIRLYRDPQGDLISVSMSPSSCTGLMCSAAGQIIYHVKSKRANFFATFRTAPEVRMLAFNRGNIWPLYLSKSFEGDPHGVAPSTVTYELFEPDSSGRYVRYTKADGKHFYLKHTIQPDGSAKADTLEEHWTEEVGCRNGF